MTDQTVTQNSEAPVTVKDGMGASGAGGASGISGSDLGFAIPSDYGVGKRQGEDFDFNMVDENGKLVEVEVKAETLANLPEQTEPEQQTFTYDVRPVTREDGTNALIVTTDNIAEVVVETPGVICRNAVDVGDKDFTQSYMALAPDHPVRKRAETLDRAFRMIAAKRWKMQGVHNAQRKLAADMISSIRTLQSTLIELQNSEGDASKSIIEQKAKAVFDSIKTALENNGVKFSELSPSLSVVSNNISKDGLGAVHSVDSMIGLLDNSISELEDVARNGGHSATSEYRDTQSQFERMQAEVDKMKRDIRAAYNVNDRSMKSLGGKNSMGDNPAVKQNYRLLEESSTDNKVKEEGLIPSNVPNYRLAIDTSPRLCGNCRFFNGTDDPLYGYCSAFNFSARANYLCDAWQSQNLTAIHTAVRSAKMADPVSVSDLVGKLEAFVNNNDFTGYAGLVTDAAQLLSEVGIRDRQLNDAFAQTYYSALNLIQKDDNNNLVSGDSEQDAMNKFQRTWDSLLSAASKYTSAGKSVKNNSEEGDFPLHTKTPVIPVHGEPHEKNGVVQGVVHPIIDLQNKPFDLQVGADYNAPQEPEPNAAMRAVGKDYVPGDIVYSKALNSIALVQGSVDYNGTKMYQLKLIDANGVAKGSGFTYGSDLQLRSNKAVKAPASVKSVDPDINDMIATVRDVYKALKAVVDQHTDLKTAPLSNKDVISPLLSDITNVMKTDLFTNVTTGPGRKYYRAVQNAMVAVGAARQVLFEGYKVINIMKRSGDTKAGVQIPNVMMKAQSDSYQRIKEALKHIEDALTIPSATHDFQAPGLE